MSSSSIVKWALAALLAVPAMPLLARTPTLKTATLTRHSKLSTGKRHARRYHRRSHRHSALTSHRRTHRTLSAHSRRHVASMSAAAEPRPTIHLTHTPPSIDGIGA